MHGGLHCVPEWPDTPEMDGYMAAAKIRSLDDPYFKTVPIIALTASAMTDIKERALNSGMNDYISKPFDAEMLRSKISGFVKKDIADNTIVPGLYGNNFEFYTQGNPDFKKELSDLIIKNIQELAVSIEMIKSKEGAAQFHSAVHKTKTALKFLGDDNFEKLIGEIQRKLQAGETLDGELSAFKIYSGKLLRDIAENLR